MCKVSIKTDLTFLLEFLLVQPSKEGVTNTRTGHKRLEKTYISFVFSSDQNCTAVQVFFEILYNNNPLEAKSKSQQISSNPKDTL